MSRLSEIGIARRLGLIVAGGAVALAVLASIGLLMQHRLELQGHTVSAQQTCLAALNHLDTRQSELKVDGYRSAVGQDVTKDVADDVVSSTEAADAVAASCVPEVAAKFAGYRPDFVKFGEFMTQFVKEAVAEPASVRSRLGEIADRNNATDDALGGLVDEVTAAVAHEQAEMTGTVASTRVLTLLVAAAGLAVLIALAIPLARSILVPVGKLAAVIDALARGDLTGRSGINDFQTTIASAVEEQTATTGEMSRSIAEVASGSSRIAQSIADVSTASAGAVRGVEQTRHASTDVARTADELRHLVGTFRL